MIKVEKLKIGDFIVNAPHGLSELLEECWVKESEYKIIDYGYVREVFIKNGHIVTRLTKKKETC